MNDELNKVFLPIALKSGTVDENGQRTSEFDNWDEIIKDAIAALQSIIDREKAEARKEQVMQDFTLISVVTAIDESKIIKWRDEQLAELNKTKE
jgi:Arc/MetJ-type ribon-helix-helix transcriptional regulator